MNLWGAYQACPEAEITPKDDSSKCCGGQMGRIAELTEKNRSCGFPKEKKTWLNFQRKTAPFGEAVPLC